MANGRAGKKYCPPSKSHPKTYKASVFQRGDSSLRKTMLRPLLVNFLGSALAVLKASSQCPSFKGKAQEIKI